MQNNLNLLRRMPLILVVVIAFGVSAAVTVRVFAQSSESPWKQPSNVSQSGAASQAQLAVAPDGTLHAVWWDTEKGEQYSYTTDINGTNWTRSVTLPDIFGRRDVDSQTARVSFTPPREVHLAATTEGDIHVFWLNEDNELLSAQARTSVWSEAGRRAESASVVNIAADSSGGLHLAYARPADTATAPAGIYYRNNRNDNWSEAALVYASPYFRAIKPENVHLSVASNEAGQVLLTWDDPQFGQSVYARSTDGGVTWAEPQVVNGAAGSSKLARVASAPTGEMLLNWQDTSSGGCGYVQRHSLDGGATWTSPEKVFGTLAQCNLDWSFMPANGRLWLVGRPKAQAENLIGEVILAVWDGSQWSAPATVSLTFFDDVANRTISLSCLNVAINGESAGLLGCDPANDVWAARSNIPVNELIPQLQPVWSPLTPLSDRSMAAATEDLPALAGNREGVFFALWSQDTLGSDSGSALYATAGNAGRWTRTARILESPERDSSNASKSIQPALTIDARDKAHAVWSSGTNGRIYYSWTYARDFNSASAWARPITLPSPGGLSSWPDIAADPRGDQLYATFAVPLNENRGIYLVRSVDSGTSWSTPTLVLDAIAAKWDSVDMPRIALDPSSDTLHIVWLRKLPPGGVGEQAVYYARSVDRGQTWSRPLLVASGNVDWPRIIVGGPNQVYIGWNEYLAPRRPDSVTPMTAWGQFSPDGGQRWAAPINIRSLKQISGPVALASDGNGHVYVAAIGKSSSDESTLYSVEWNGRDWEERPALALQQRATAGNSAVIAVAPNQGLLGVLLRHRFWNSDGTTQLGIDATEREVAAGPLVAGPTFTPQPAPTTQATATPQVTATPRPQLNSSTRQPASDSGGLNPFVWGAILAAIVVVAAVARTIWIRRG